MGTPINHWYLCTTLYSGLSQMCWCIILLLYLTWFFYYKVKYGVIEGDSAYLFTQGVFPMPCHHSQQVHYLYDNTTQTSVHSPVCGTYRLVVDCFRGANGGNAVDRHGDDEHDHLHERHPVREERSETRTHNYNSHINSINDLWPKKP